MDEFVAALKEIVDHNLAADHSLLDLCSKIIERLNEQQQQILTLQEQLLSVAQQVQTTALLVTNRDKGVH